MENVLNEIERWIQTVCSLFGLAQWIESAP